jgi:hypothetical protein
MKIDLSLSLSPSLSLSLSLSLLILGIPRKDVILVPPGCAHVSESDAGIPRRRLNDRSALPLLE